LQAERQRANLSQAQLAEDAGLASNHLARLERGEKVYPRFDTVAKLAAQLGVSLDWIASECGLANAKKSNDGPALRRILTAVTAASERGAQTQAELQEAASELRSALGLGPPRRRGRT
jgi:transcriptional regulator with XRE-family HTH domain